MGASGCSDIELEKVHAVGPLDTTKGKSCGWPSIRVTNRATVKRRPTCPITSLCRALHPAAHRSFMVSSRHFRGKEPAREGLPVEKLTRTDHSYDGKADARAEALEASARVRSASAPRLAKREHPRCISLPNSYKFFTSVSLSVPKAANFRGLFTKGLQAGLSC